MNSCLLFNIRLEVRDEQTMALYRTALLVAAAIIFVNGKADCAGVAVLEQSVKHLGTAFAGGAAADDAATIFYNPAGLIRLSGSQAVAGY